MQSGYGFLHGGASAALVDLVGSAAIDSAGPPRPGSTVEVNVAYLATAFAGVCATLTTCFII